MYSLLHLRDGLFGICLSCFLATSSATGNSMAYLGMFDATGSTTLLGKYDAGTSSLTTVLTPFASFDYLKFSPVGVLYGVDGAALYVIDPATGAATNGVTLNDGESEIICCGLAFKPDGTMVVHEYSNRTGSWLHKLYSGDPTTGTLTYIADITGVTGLYGIEYANGVLYGTYDNALYSINETTGAATLIGTSASGWDLVFGTDNIMRATGPNNGALYTIDLTSGAATLVHDFQLADSKEAVGLVVACSPTITQEPVSRTAHAGDSVTLSVTAGGTAVLSYQWQKKNDNNEWLDISGATSNTYTLSSFAVTDAGGYHCVISNLAGNITSNFVSINPGDANRDGSVDVGDLGILAANYGKSSGATWAMGDFNDDEAVDVGDLGVLAAHYGFGPGNRSVSSSSRASLQATTATEELMATIETLGLIDETESDPVTVVVDPGIDVGDGLTSYTVHLVANSEANEVIAFDGEITGSMHQKWSYIDEEWVSNPSSQSTSANAQKDSHFLFISSQLTSIENPDENNDLSGLNGNGTGTYLRGVFATTTRAIDIPYAKIVLAAGQEVALNATVANINGAKFIVGVVIGESQQ